MGGGAGRRLWLALLADCMLAPFVAQRVQSPPPLALPKLAKLAGVSRDDLEKLAHRAPIAAKSVARFSEAPTSLEERHHLGSVLFFFF